MVKAETIDLTLDSPPKPTKLASAPVRGRMQPPTSAPLKPPVTVVSDEPMAKITTTEDDDTDILAFMKQAHKAQLHKTNITPLRARVFTPEHEVPLLPILDRRGGVAQRRSDRAYQSQ